MRFVLCGCVDVDVFVQSLRTSEQAYTTHYGICASLVAQYARIADAAVAVRWL